MCSPLEDITFHQMKKKTTQDQGFQVAGIMSQYNTHTRHSTKLLNLSLSKENFWHLVIVIVHTKRQSSLSKVVKN